METEYRRFVRKLIRDFLDGANFPIKEERISDITNEKGMEVFWRAVTTKKYAEEAGLDSEDSYERYEVTGDRIWNLGIAEIMGSYFEDLARKSRVRDTYEIGVHAKAISVWTSRAKQSEIAEKMGFWRFIRRTSEITPNMKKEYLEDVLEAFCRALALNVNRQKWFDVPGRKSSTLFDNFGTLFALGFVRFYATQHIRFDQLTREKLFDMKTIIKEIVDKIEKGHLKTWGKNTRSNYIHKISTDQEGQFISHLYFDIVDGDKHITRFESYGKGSSKLEAEKDAARNLYLQNYDVLNEIRNNFQGYLQKFRQSVQTR